MQDILDARYSSLRYSGIKDGPIISHLAYADDIVIFCNGSSQSIKRHEFFG